MVGKKIVKKALFFVGKDFLYFFIMQSLNYLRLSVGRETSKEQLDLVLDALESISR